MKATNFPHPAHGPVGTFVSLAQATFFDALPSNTQQRQPTAPTTPPAGMLPAPHRRRWLAALDHWFHRQRMKERDAYLAQSQNVYELEARIRRLERRPYY